MHRRLHGRAGYRKVAGVTVTAALGLAAVAACSSSSTTSASTASNTGHVTVGGFCAPPSSSPVPYKEWNEDVATFEKANPNITIQSIYSAQCDVPATLTAQLAAGTEPDVYETYFGDLNQALDAGQAADITQYVNSTTVPVWKDIVPSAIAPVTAGKTLYGIPIFNYTQGLVINRQLFTEAGLNPNTPPTTWAQVETDAAAITKLGNGIYGYGDYSADNNGGWHFTSELDANGGAMTNATGTTASFDTTQGTQVLDALHTLRFTDKAMSATEALGWGTLQKQMAAGKLGMYIAAPDDIYQVIVPERRRQHQRLRNGSAAKRQRHPGRHAVRRRRLPVRQAGHPRPDRGRHQVDQLPGPDPGPGPVQPRAEQGRRHTGRILRAADVRWRHRDRLHGPAGQVHDYQRVLLLDVRQREREARRPAGGRSGALQDA